MKCSMIYALFAITIRVKSGADYKEPQIVAINVNLDSSKHVHILHNIVYRITSILR